MSMTKLQKAIHQSLSLASPKLAADSKFVTLVQGAKSRKAFDKPAFTTAILAMDADIPQEQLSNALDALMETETDPAATVPPTPAPVAGSGDNPAPAPVVPAGSKRDKIAALLKGKIDDQCMAELMGIVGDEAPEPKPKEDDKEMDKKVETAMDSMRSEFASAAEAREVVRPIVGAVDPKVMDAAVIYGLALDHMTVPHDGIKDAKSLKRLVEVAHAGSKPATAPKLAHDAASQKSFTEKFPGASRFK